jgi:hypothetical protein
MEPGPLFGQLLKAAFDAQLDGVFDDIQGGQEFVANL